MTLDLLVRGGTVVDGTGAPPRTADVAIADGRIVAVGRIGDAAARTIDADGCVVTPGFVDVHTHYEAQLQWDPTASSASWHGVTTVLAANCGFSLAPARPDDVEWLAQMLSRVEGMSPATLANGTRFRGGSFGDFLGGFEGRLGVNMGAYAPHSPIRRLVMGEDASVRPATAAEIRAMQDELRAALRAGAIGFSSSQLDIHVAHDGRGVPSNHAAPDELVALASVLAEFGHGAIEFIPRSQAEGMNDADRTLLLDMARASGGKPVEIQTLVPLPHQPDGWRRGLELARAAHSEGLRIHPMFATNQLGAFFSLDSTFLFDEIPSFRETLTLPHPERLRRLRDPALRERMRRELADPTGRAFMFVWCVLFVDGVTDPAHRAWVGRHVEEIAAEHAKDPLDCFLDLALAEDLRTQFVLTMPREFPLRDLTETLVRDPIVVAGSSDGGAHVLSFVGSDYTTRLLTEWVPGVLSLEEAVARLTSGPARIHGLRDRGTLLPGAWADVTIWDPARLAVGATRLARDFPAGGARYVVDAEGYVATVVNGHVLMDGGRHTGALPGHVLRGR
jgi:N-acyl-D-aspartate/D-glutamate deacylase